MEERMSALEKRRKQRQPQSQAETVDLLGHLT